MAGILKVSISDHYAIFCILKYATIQDKTKIVKKSNLCEKNIATFTTQLNNENWDFVFMSECAQSAFSRFQSVIDIHFTKNNKATFENYNRAKKNMLKSSLAMQKYNTIVISLKCTKLISPGLGRY